MSRVKKDVSKETFIFLAIFFFISYYIVNTMGLINTINTVMSTAYRLLIDTVFYIMAIAVLAGAVSSLFSEFGVVALLNRLLSVFMKPLYSLPGSSALGILTCYLSDNPAILTLAHEKNFLKFFKKFQIPALTNLGTSFGMGLIVSTFIMAVPSPSGESFIRAAVIGNLGAICGSIVSVRLMLMFCKKEIGDDSADGSATDTKIEKTRTVREGSTMTRFLNAMLDGGKIGVDMGMAIIPGVLLICTFVLILTNGTGAGGEYTGGAFEGVRFLPYVGQKLNFVLKPLFGFTSPECIAVPITALGAAGAAIGLIPELVKNGLANGNDLAVFTAICMCWSGYLSTHVAMMDGLGYPNLIGKAILSHTIGGLVAGVSAHWIFMMTSTLL